nr:hypothetical protein B0A51_16673 [Rachicladosporium sp. CCFEE 5018]
MSREMPHLPKTNSPCGPPQETSSNSFWHSEPSPLLLGHRSTRHLPEKVDVVVIGSGLTGTSAARHLLRPTASHSNAKLDVLMLEAREACWGATGRNGGHCQPLLFEHPQDPSIGEFELRNYNTLKQLIEAEDIDCEWVSQPGVRAIYGAETVERAKKALEVVKGNAPHLANLMRLVTDKTELAKYRIATADGAMVTSVAARMWPYKLVAHLLEDLLTASDLQGTFNLQTLTLVQGISPANTGEGYEVETARGTVFANRVIVATNAYTSFVLPTFTGFIVPCRGQMSALKPLQSLSSEHRLKTSMGFEGDGLDDYLIQRPNERGGHLMFGGGRTNARSIGVTDDSFVDSRTAAYLRRQVVTVFDLPEKDSGSQEPQVELTATHEWTGIMGFSRDEVPWVGPVPGWPGVFIAAGFTGHGMPNTFLSGAAAAIMVRTAFDGMNEKESTAKAVKETGLPKKYLCTEERRAKCQQMESVEEREEGFERVRRVNAVASGA